MYGYRRFWLKHTVFYIHCRIDYTAYAFKNAFGLFLKLTALTVAYRVQNHCPCCADRQTGGRGRLGRTFLSPAGVGVYLSILLRPDCRPMELMHLTCAAAEAMCDAVETTTGLRPGIKWTNDLVVGNRKIAGILTENGLNAQGLVDYAIIGTGINC